ncbi:MAG: hypothetical protein R3D26_22700 [Cyanobacteriota/Melainabacteria group bacterium]
MLEALHGIYARPAMVPTTIKITGKSRVKAQAPNKGKNLLR